MVRSEASKLCQSAQIFAGVIMRPLSVYIWRAVPELKGKRVII